MKLSHSFTVPAPVDRVWETFMDLERVGGCFPGATVTEVDGDSFSGIVKVKLGPIALVYNGSGRFIERDEAGHRAVIEAKGKDKRGNGTAGADVTIQLTAEGDNTRADVETELAVTGKPAQFGRGVMQDVSDKLLQKFVECIERQLAAPDPTPAEPVEATTSPAEPVEATPAEPVEAKPTPAEPTQTLAEPVEANPTPTEPTSLAEPVKPTPAEPKPTLAEPKPSLAEPVEAKPTPTSPRHIAADEDDALDLGSAVLPVVMRQVAPYLIGGIGGFILAALALRRRNGSE